jgi:hypothetical protein
MDNKEYQYFKEKYNLPIIIEEDKIEGKVIDKYIDGDEFVVIIFNDNTCLVLKGSDSGSIRAQDEWDVEKDEYLTTLRYNYPELYKEYKQLRKSKWQEAEKKRKYEQYLRLKKEFE